MYIDTDDGRSIMDGMIQHAHRLGPREYIELEGRYGANNYKPLDVVLERGEGVWVFDVEGKRYLDCLSAYSAVNQGHCHPRIFKAMVEQAAKLTLTSRAFRNNQLGLFYRELAELTNSHKVLPMNSGAEAVETAIKVVRKWGYREKGVPQDRAEIIVSRDNFHGRTVAIVGFSSDHRSRDGFGPFPGGFNHVPFGDEEAIENEISANTVAVMLEPIQGEAGPKHRGKLPGSRHLSLERRDVLLPDRPLPS